ncbi:MAG: MIP family channel protein [Proteobacteria bacterium]|nr:MIP family channel protein [Pseudomonadota bacterium]
MTVGTEDLSSPAAWRASVAEFIATLLFIFIGAGTVVVTGGLLGEPLTSARLVAIALAHGLAIALLVAATANISGGHVNPAVTFGAWVAGRIGLARAAMYVVAQLLGAALGAWLLSLVVPEAAQGNLGAHGLGQGISAAGGLLAEIVLTFVLVFVVFATAIDPKGPGTIAPLAIGLAILVDHLVGVPLTGAGMNPARSFGPALVAGAWANHWVYWVGPAVGGAIAALVYRHVFLERRE